MKVFIIDDPKHVFTYFSIFLQIEPWDVLYQLSSYLQTNKKYISELAETFLKDEKLTIQQYLGLMMGLNNHKPDELMLVIMARMFKVKFCIARKNRRLWFSTKGGSLMDCDLYMGKVSFKKYALYADANFEFTIIESCIGKVEERNVSGASSAINNSDDLSSEDVNNIVIIQENPHAHSEDKNCDKSGDDVGSITASDPEKEILKTYSIAAQLVDAINEKEGNSVVMIPDNETDEGSAVADNVIEPNRDHEMFSDLEMDTLENIPEKRNASPNHSGSGNILDNVESNVKLPEGSNSENQMVSDYDNGPDNDELIDNEQEEFSAENDTYDNTCQDVGMEPNDNDDLQDNEKPSEKNTNGNEIARDELLSEIFQDDTEPAGKDTSKDNHIVKEGEVDNDRRDNSSNECAVNSIELNVSATISDYDDADSQRTIDLDQLQQQDVSSLQSSDLDLELDADDNTMTKLAAKLNKSTCEKDKQKN